MFRPRARPRDHSRVARTACPRQPARVRVSRTWRRVPRVDPWFPIAGRRSVPHTASASDASIHPIIPADSHKMAKRTKKVGTYSDSARRARPGTRARARVFRVFTLQRSAGSFHSGFRAPSRRGFEPPRFAREANPGVSIADARSPSPPRPTRDRRQVRYPLRRFPPQSCEEAGGVAFRFLCDFCGKYAMKRTAVGIWACTACKKQKAGGAYVLNTSAAAPCAPPSAASARTPRSKWRFSRMGARWFARATGARADRRGTEHVTLATGAVPGVRVGNGSATHVIFVRHITRYAIHDSTRRLYTRFFKRRRRTDGAARENERLPKIRPARFARRRREDLLVHFTRRRPRVLAPRSPPAR